MAGDLADDGKRLDALDVVYGAGGCYRGGSLREGSGSPVFADGTPGGFSCHRRQGTQSFLYKMIRYGSNLVPICNHFGEG